MTAKKSEQSQIVPEYMSSFEKKVFEALFGDGTENHAGLVIDVRDVKAALEERRKSNIDIKKGVVIAWAVAVFTQFLNWGKDHLK